MKPVLIVKSRPQIGLKIADVPYGTIVQRAFNSDGECFYQVVSPMDGSGAKALVTLQSGTLKHVPQDLMVVPVRAEIHIYGEWR